MDPLIVYNSNWKYPVILGGEKGFIVASRGGELSTPWSRYGPTIDFGGFYTPPIRATGPIIPTLYTVNEFKRLGDYTYKSIYYGSHIETHHKINGFKITSTIYTAREKPIAIINLNIQQPIRNNKSTEINLYIESWGGPLEYDGILPENINIKYKNETLIMRTDEWHTICKSSPPPTKYIIGDVSKDIIEKIKKLPTAAPNKTVPTLFTWDIHSIKGNKKNITISIASSDKGYKTVKNYAEEGLRKSGEILRRNIEEYEKYINNTINIETPSENINKAFTLAKAALYTLRSRQPEEGIVAGYPWFARYWSRDAAWIIPALILIGDHEYAKKYIDTFLKYQARDDYEILGGKKGEILMHYGYKTLFYYGAADSTLYYPILIHLYTFATADKAYAKKRWRNLLNMITWGYRKDIDGDGLIEHILEEPAKYFFIDTTWMDTIYRGIKPIEIQALWAAALDKAAELAELNGKIELSRKWREISSKIKNKIINDYWNPNTEYFYDRITEDGSKDESIRPNALIALIHLTIPREKALKSLKRLEQPDMLTEWGLRTLSSRDRKYSPEKYHNGMVWPLVTGWLALAEYKYGRIQKGHELIELMARQIIKEGGMYAEVYRGDREKPQYSCILQAWSITLYIQALLEGMLGINLDAINKKIKLSPKLPIEWSKLKINRLKMGEIQLDIEIDKELGIAIIDNQSKETISLEIYSEERLIKPGKNEIRI